MNVGNIKTPSNNVGSNQEGNLSSLEVLNWLEPLGLRHIAVALCCAKAIDGQESMETCALDLFIGEDDHTIAETFLDQGDQGGLTHD